MIITTRITGNINGVTWYRLTDLNHCFSCEVVGLTDGGRIIDCDGIPSTAGGDFDLRVRDQLNLM